jgi:hypothetical protein
LPRDATFSGFAKSSQFPKHDPEARRDIPSEDLV